MGKYMRKAKATGEVALMEVSQASLGVRTRAKTLALKRLQKSSPDSNSPTAKSSTASSGGSYLQLRSRRLEKPPIVTPNQEAKKQKQVSKLGCVQNPNSKANSNHPRQASSRLRVGPVASGSRGGSVSVSRERVNDKNGGQKAEEAKEIVGFDEQVQGINNGDLGIEEASFGENVLEFEVRERWVFFFFFFPSFSLNLCLNHFLFWVQFFLSLFLLINFSLILVWLLRK